MRATSQVDDLAWCIMREISKMCYNPIDEDVTRAKNQLKAAILFSQDNLSGMYTLHLHSQQVKLLIFCEM